MRGVWSSLALAWSLPTTVFSDPKAIAEPVSALQLVERSELVERQSTNNASAATWIYHAFGGRGGFDRDGDGSGPPPGRGPPAGVDIDDDDDGAFGNITFSITVNPDNDDMWFRIAAPAMYSWIGIGAGTNMGNAQAMFMAWEGEQDDSIILTARSGCDQCEPAYMKGFGVNAQQGNSSDRARLGIRDGMYYINGFVANGTRRAGIDAKSKSQSFIWAVGPRGQRPNSDAFDAPLRMHDMHGGFQLDMTQAKGNALPTFQTTSKGVTQQGGASRDHERSSSGHALLMCVGFVIVLPLGIILLRTTKKLKIHMIVQGIGLLLITIGWAVGFYISRKYQRSMHYTHHHQIIGIIVYILLLAQWLLGFFHHRVYVKTQQPTWMIKPHKFGLGGVVIALGIINCAVGFRFAMAPYYNMIFVPIVLGIAILLIGTMVFRGVMKKRKARMFGGPPPPNYQAPAGSQVPPALQPSGGAAGYYGQPSAASSTVGASWNNRDEVELNKMGPPPAYSGEPQKPREMV